MLNLGFERFHTALTMEGLFTSLNWEPSGISPRPMRLTETKHMKNCRHPFRYSGASAFTFGSVHFLLDPSLPRLPGLRKGP